MHNYGSRSAFLGTTFFFQALVFATWSCQHGAGDPSTIRPCYMCLMREQPTTNLSCVINDEGLERIVLTSHAHRWPMYIPLLFYEKSFISSISTPFSRTCWRISCTVSRVGLMRIVHSSRTEYRSLDMTSNRRLPWRRLMEGFADIDCLPGHGNKVT